MDPVQTVIGMPNTAYPLKLHPSLPITSRCPCCTADCPLLLSSRCSCRGCTSTLPRPAPDTRLLCCFSCPALQVALTSPYVVPQVPLERVINNTIAHLNDGKLPSSAKQWVQMAGNAGNFFAQNMPFFMARAMQVCWD